MATVEVDISMSVDGFVTGPDPDKWPGLGKGDTTFTFATGGVAAAIEADPATGLGRSCP